MILTLWLIFIFWAFKYYRPPKPKHKAPPGLTAAQIERNRKQAEREQTAAEKRQAQIEQANSDIGHYSENLDGLYKMQADTMRLLDDAQKEVNTDNQFNQYGAVISVKTAARHIAKRDKYQKQLFTINNQIHNAEKQKRKAERIIDSAGQ